MPVMPVHLSNLHQMWIHGPLLRMSTKDLVRDDGDKFAFSENESEPSSVIMGIDDIHAGGSILSNILQ